MKNILGIKAGHHDPGAAIITADGRICAISEERLNRVKHATGMFPKLSMEYVVKNSNLSYRDIDLVAIDRVGLTDIEAVFRNNAPGELLDKDVLLVNHHESHAASAAFCSGFDEALIMVIDGSGEGFRKRGNTYAAESMSVYKFTEGRLTELDKVLHARNKKAGWYVSTTGIGKFYSKITRYIGFGPYQEGKTMGLAPYVLKDIDLVKKHGALEWYRVDNGRIYCNIIVYPQSGSLYDMTKSKIHYYYFLLNALLNRNADEPSFGKPVYIKRPARGKETTLPDSYYTEIGCLSQQILERAIIESARFYQNRTGLRKICTAGGVALNIDANSKLLTDTDFEEIFTQPASSDAGIPLGNALLAYYKEVDYRKKRFTMEHAYLGREYSEKEVRDALAGSNLEYERHEDIDNVTADLLADNKIIGWFQGASEYGPRALGNRSILMSPLNKDNKDILNYRVKKREGFRPFAPIACKEYAEEYFDMPARESKFMLLVAKVRDGYIDKIPAVTHVDGTARVQTLDCRHNKVTYNLIKKFGDRTGFYVLLNTSFNIAGEPIVETPEDAINGFNNCGLDYLVMGRFLCRKKKR